MRFSLCEAFSKFFVRHQLIEFAEVLSSEEVDLIEKSTKQGLEKALGSKPLDLASNTDLWMAGRNHYLVDGLMKRALLKSPIGQIAAFLYKKSPIRIAYTQAFFSLADDIPIKEPFNLTEISSVDPMLGGALICFNDSEEKPQELLPDLRRHSKGHVIFFSSSCPIPFPDLFKQKGLQCLLIGFAPSRIRYKLQPLDLHTHALKKLGYVFGDSIEEKDSLYLYH